jgi:hypothetical protein
MLTDAYCHGFWVSGSCFAVLNSMNVIAANRTLVEVSPVEAIPFAIARSHLQGLLVPSISFLLHSAVHRLVFTMKMISRFAYTGPLKITIVVLRISRTPSSYQGGYEPMSNSIRMCILTRSFRLSSAEVFSMATNPMFRHSRLQSWPLDCPV